MPLSKENRLTKKKEIDGLFKSKKTVRGDFLFIRYNPNGGRVSKFVFIIPTKVYGKAVDRNRVRRVLSEVIRPKIVSLNSSYSVAITISKKADESVLKRDLIRSLDQIIENEKYIY